MIFDILTLFPEMFQSPLESSLLKKAREKGLIQVNLHNIRDHARGKHRVTDDYPYGGGAGMVMKVEPVAEALDALFPDRGATPVILLTPQGETFSQAMAREFAGYGRIILVCGRYEGVDERVREHLVDREVSIGDYVLTGGELPALVMVDAVSRLVPGVLGNVDSAWSESHTENLLEWPQYTRPAEYRGWKVPEVLIEGHHKNIEEWRRRESLRRTLRRRPDLLEKADLSELDLKILEALKKEG
jgi:tRNA (guanine37-N1)-methyltransferase